MIARFNIEKQYIATVYGILNINCDYLNCQLDNFTYCYIVYCLHYCQKYLCRVSRLFVYVLFKMKYKKEIRKKEKDSKICEMTIYINIYIYIGIDSPRKIFLILSVYPILIFHPFASSSNS